MSQLSFSINWDYRCPFARNAHEHVVAALEAGADWDVTFAPFSLSQVHVGEGDPPVWENPAKRGDLLAMESAIAVRDHMPEAFRALHLGLFRARHDQSRDLRDAAVLHEVLGEAGLDPAAVMAEVDTGRPLETFRSAHEEAVAERSVFGVPTFVADGEAVFVRIMTRPDGDPKSSIAVIERVLELVTGHPELNEVKHTKIPR